MAEFKQAVGWLVEGKKVRRRAWNPDQYIYRSNEAILWQNNMQVKFRIHQFEAVDWELYDEKSLSSCGGIRSEGKGWRSVDDIKEFIEKLKDVRIEIITYPCDLEVCVKCNTVYANQKVWFIYEGKKYHLKCLLDKLAGPKLT